MKEEIEVTPEMESRINGILHPSTNQPLTVGNIQLQDLKPFRKTRSDKGVPKPPKPPADVEQWTKLRQCVEEISDSAAALQEAQRRATNAWLDFNAQIELMKTPNG